MEQENFIVLKRIRSYLENCAMMADQELSDANEQEQDLIRMLATVLEGCDQAIKVRSEVVSVVRVVMTETYEVRVRHAADDGEYDVVQRAEEAVSNGCVYCEDSEFDSEIDEVLPSTYAADVEMY